MNNDQSSTLVSGDTASIATTAKNMSHIASILGTWSIWSNLKASLGSYQVVSYFVVHFMKDPTSEYACQINDGTCNERDNRLCQLHLNQGNHRLQSECHDVTDTVSDWSDVAAFFYVGFHVHAGVPFQIDQSKDTGGWIGPFHLVLAQDNANNNNDNKIDRYVARYVTTPSTALITAHKPVNQSLFIDFDTVMGTSAVHATQKRQAQLQHGDNAYQEYSKTCDNGDMEPLLPRFGFEFIQSPTNDDDWSLHVEADYQMPVLPRSHNRAYKLMPWIQREVNAFTTGKQFRLDGPFCYQDDPKRAYSLSVSLDETLHLGSATNLSRNVNKKTSAVQLERGCVQGLPCLPPAAARGGDNDNSNNPIVPSCPTVFDVSKLAYQGGFWLMLIVWIATLVLLWVQRRKRRRRQQQQHQQQQQQRSLEEDQDTRPSLSGVPEGSPDEDEEEEQEEDESTGNRLPVATNTNNNTTAAQAIDEEDLSTPLIPPSDASNNDTGNGKRQDKRNATTEEDSAV